MLRDKTVTSASKIITEMVEEYNNFKINKNKGLTSEKLLEDAKKFVSKDYLDKHFNIIERVTIVLKEQKCRLYDELEQKIIFNDIKNINSILCHHQAFSVIEMLRLLCLFCLVNDGLTEPEINLIKRTIIIYYNDVFVVDNLIITNLLYIKNGIKRWDRLVNEFVLFPEYNDIISDKYNGYAPLLCRLVENALLGFQDVKIYKKMSLISNDVFTLSQDNIVTDNVILIYVIGGITYSEIAALRSLKQINPDKEIIIATTKIINSSILISSLI